MSWWLLGFGYGMLLALCLAFFLGLVQEEEDW